MNTNPNWIIDLFASIDNRDAATFASFISDDGEFIFGNNEGVVGKVNIEAYVDGFFKSIKAISHKGLESWVSGSTTITRGTVTYTRHNDTLHTVDFCNVFNMDNEKIKEYKIYIDNSELYQ